MGTWIQKSDTWRFCLDTGGRHRKSAQRFVDLFVFFRISLVAFLACITIRIPLLHIEVSGEMICVQSVLFAHRTPSRQRGFYAFEPGLLCVISVYVVNEFYDTFTLFMYIPLFVYIEKLFHFVFTSSFDFSVVPSICALD